VKVEDYLHEWETNVGEGEPAAQGSPFAVAARALLAESQAFFDVETMVTSDNDLDTHFGFDSSSDNFEPGPVKGVRFDYSGLHARGLSLAQLRAKTGDFPDADDRDRLNELWDRVENFILEDLPKKEKPLPPLPDVVPVNDRLVATTRLLTGAPSAGIEAVQAAIDKIYTTAVVADPLDGTVLARLRAQFGFRRALELAYGAAELFDTKPQPPPDAPWAGRVEVRTLNFVRFRWLGTKPSPTQVTALEELMDLRPSLRPLIESFLVLSADWKEARLHDVETPLKNAPAVPAALEKKLHFCKYEVRYNGIMSAAVRAELEKSLTSTPDRNALARLHTATVRHALQGHAALLRTRRGGVKPGEIEIALP
jgi:hypothetical protein